MKKPVVSVIMVAYNAEQSVSEAVESVLSQSFSDFEFIVTDDGSEDRTLDILRDFAQRDARISVRAGTHLGLCPHLNRDIDDAQAELIARMDADDICLPARFERQVHFMREHPEIHVLGTSYDVLDQEGEKISTVTPPLRHEDIDAKNLAGGGGLAHPSVMIRKQALLSVGKYGSGRYAQDTDLFLRMAEAGYRFANLPEVLIRYRLSRSNITCSRRAEQVRTGAEAIRRAHARRGLQPPKGNDNRVVGARKQEPYLSLASHIAVDGGNVKAARRYAWQAVREEPFAPVAWRALVRALLGRSAVTLRNWLCSSAS